MILNHTELEHTIVSNLKLLVRHEKIRVTSLLSGPSCGKTTLTEAMQLASRNVGGFLVTDMSNIIDWHQKDENQSILRQSFIAAEEARSRGDLVDDLLVFAGFVSYLVFMQKHSVFGEFRKILISGLPRKSIQAEFLFRYFPFNLAYIDCPQEEADRRRLKRIDEGTARSDDTPERFQYRWKKFFTDTYPVVEGFQQKHPDRFEVIGYKKTPHQKAISLLKVMNLKEEERNSLLHQLVTPQCDAWKRLDRVLNPKKYPSALTTSNGTPSQPSQLTLVTP